MEPNRIDSAASSPATPLEQREQRWENEGGSPRKDA
jgi:hypothetical protein